MSRQRAARWAAAFALFAQPGPALVFCVTNAVDVHQLAPTGSLAASGWQQTWPVDLFLGTAIQSNALLTAKHIWEIDVGDSFSAEGATHTVTAKVGDAASDLAVLFITPPVTNIARLNIETNETASDVVLQGRGLERGEVVVTAGHTNGWRWAWDKWWAVRRWGVNRFIGEAEDGLLAVAAFDDNGDPDECMLSVGDSGGPGFIRTGSGWKLATVNYSVFPVSFTASTNPAAAFDASLFDCAGLYFDNGGEWEYVPPEASPSPCLLYGTRVARRIAWLTNTVAGLDFPADLGVSWRVATNAPDAGLASTGLWFEVVASNAGPYTARDVAVELGWGPGVRVCGAVPSLGAYETNRWSLPALEDGGAATLRVDAVVWRAAAGWATNRASVAASDKPDGAASNNAAECELYLPETATRLLVQ